MDTLMGLFATSAMLSTIIVPTEDRVIVALAAIFGMLAAIWFKLDKEFDNGQ
jgi:hypothetical protein